MAVICGFQCYDEWNVLSKELNLIKPSGKLHSCSEWHATDVSLIESMIDCSRITGSYQNKALFFKQSYHKRFD